jgi:hypothetical protein
LKQHYIFSIRKQSSCELLAFILYLCSLKQPTAMLAVPTGGCELLAFILYLCSLKQPIDEYNAVDDML